MIKTLNLPDFAEPDLRTILARVYGPGEHHFRKAWEVAQALRWFADLPSNAWVLAVGAGHDAAIYALTMQARWVFATDLYDQPGVWADWARRDMLIDPIPYAPPHLTWEPRRLIAQHMDALRLRYEDQTFDAVVSLSSIEHFGSFDDCATAMREMARVLKPGGRIGIATELKLAGNGNGWPGVNLFTPESLMQYIVEPTGLNAGVGDFAVNAATLAEARPLIDYVNGARGGMTLF